MALALLGVSAILMYTLIQGKEVIREVPTMDEFHMYSGVHPELYKAYLFYQQHGDTRSAQDALEELALYADTDFVDEIHEKILKKQHSLSI